MDRYPDKELFMASARTTTFQNRLTIGLDAPGRVRSDLKTNEQLADFGEQLSRHRVPLTFVNTADCIDDRPVIGLADGTIDPSILALRVVSQLPGGLGLAATKAAVAANLGIIRNARNFTSAYEIMHNLLTEMGFQDGGHLVCAASTYVESSVAQPVAANILLPTIGTIIEINESRGKAFEQIQINKKRRLEAGFYGGWNPSDHADFLSQRVPHNFSELAGEHEGQAINLLTQPGMGFARNAFHAATGEKAFGVTVPLMSKLAHDLGGTAEERELLLVAFPDDLINVSDKIVAPDMPVFADAA